MSCHTNWQPTLSMLAMPLTLNAIDFFLGSKGEPALIHETLWQHWKDQFQTNRWPLSHHVYIMVIYWTWSKSKLYHLSLRCGRAKQNSYYSFREKLKANGLMQWLKGEQMGKKNTLKETCWVTIEIISEANCFLVVLQDKSWTEM